jgi:repressor LexA
MVRSARTLALTDRQRAIYDFIRSFTIDRGFCPTFREIAAHFGMRSHYGVACHLEALERKGMITRQPGASRAISLIDDPRGARLLPLVGQINAGQAVEMYELPVEWVDLYSLMLGARSVRRISPDGAKAAAAGGAA